MIGNVVMLPGDPAEGAAGNLAADADAKPLPTLKDAGHTLAAVGEALATLDERITAEIDAIRSETAQMLENIGAAVKFLNEVRDYAVKTGDEQIARLNAMRY